MGYSGWSLGQLHDEIDMKSWIIVMVAGWFFGSMGDLYESSIKRQFEIKDSGNILPGHGGFLDRLDSVIFATPIIYIYLFI